MPQEKAYTTFQIAEICGVRPTTIIQWVKHKRIKAYITLGGHRRVLESDLLRFLKDNHFPIPDKLTGAEKRIVIVEDEASVGQMLTKALRKAAPGVKVEWTQNGIEALLALGKSQPDLMVLDVVMPIVDGARVLSTLRSDPNTKGVKVIGMTGKKLSPDKLAYMRRYTDAFFIKPFDIEKFTDKALSLLQVAPTPEKSAHR